MKKKDSEGDQVAFTPEVMVCGVALLGPAGRELEPAFHAAERVLKSDYMKLAFSVSGDDVHFIAAKEDLFEAVGTPATKLTNALPGERAHRGEAAYIDDSAALSAMLLVQDGGMSVRTGPRDILLRLAASKGLEVVDLTDQPLRPWETLESYAARSAWSRFRLSLVTGILTLAAGAGVAAYSGWEVSKANRASEAATTASAALSQKLTSELARAQENPLATQLHKLGSMQEFALQHPQGYLRYWAIDGKGLRYELVLPAHLELKEGALKALPKVEKVERKGDLLFVSSGMPDSAAGSAKKGAAR